jgi:hypothetical protein
VRAMVPGSVPAQGSVWVMAPGPVMARGRVMATGQAAALVQVLVQVLVTAQVPADFRLVFATTRCPQGSRRSSAPNCSIESYVCYESTSYPHIAFRKRLPDDRAPRVVRCRRHRNPAGRHRATAGPAMSGDGRGSRLRKYAVRRRQLRGDGRPRSGAGEHDRQQQGRRVHRHHRSRQMDQRADRAMIVVGIVGTGRPLGCVTR